MRLDSSDPGFADAFETLVSARREPATDVASGVAAILADVRARGDAALHELTLRFDRIDLDQAGWSVPREARQAALQGLEPDRSEEQTSEIQSLMRNSYAVFCLKKKKSTHTPK